MTTHENENDCCYNEENNDNDDTYRSRLIYDISCDANFMMMTSCSSVEVNSRINCRTKVHRMIQWEHLIQLLFLSLFTRLI